MKLREKLKTTVSINTKGEAGRFANQCEQIADDYAIEFGKWILKKYLTPSFDDLYVNDKGNLISFKELLEIFKKEKGL